MTAKFGARGDLRVRIRVYPGGANRETKKRNYHNREIHGSMREEEHSLQLFFNFQNMVRRHIP
jgi:hypothetical protein